MNLRATKLVFILLLPFFSCNLHAEEQRNIKFAQDLVIENLATKNGLPQILKVGSLQEMSVKNRIVLEKTTFKSFDGVLSIIGIKSGDTKILEGSGMNGWHIQRLQVSVLYDIFIESNIESANGAMTSLRLRSIFIAPHQNGLYGTNLMTPQGWSAIRIIDKMDHEKQGR
ncbi:hypothetical protein [Luteolibacter sp. LG18]|uniref:hypothetical protein n=1 Tax=Luteolibacter sp. LG18 TaxID=2819286 RepID=UPI0030C6612A